MLVGYLAPGLLEGVIALLENSHDWERRLTVYSHAISSVFLYFDITVLKAKC